MNAFTFVETNFLSVFLYNIFLFLYKAGIKISANWNPKARKWTDGRKNIFNLLGASMSGARGKKVAWMHCSSLGEFEQGRPILEAIRQKEKDIHILLTFFSPSGFEVKKDYDGADQVFYLPDDSTTHAGKFLDLVNPSLVIFVKYEFWYHYLAEINRRKIPCLLISAVFRKEQGFFKWYGGLQRTMLRCFSAIFVQDENSQALLQQIHISSVVAGDTRFDTVSGIAERFSPVPSIDEFVSGYRTIVAGSTWKHDEEIIQQAFGAIKKNNNTKLIIAPHETGAAHIIELKKLFPSATLYSESVQQKKAVSAEVMIIDSVGLLSRLYQYGVVCYVGGGFTDDGVHNVLEPAVYGKPVIFGTNYQKYREAVDLVANGGATVIANAVQLQEIVNEMLNDPMYCKKAADASLKYVRSNRGATKKIMDYIDVNRLLTN